MLWTAEAVEDLKKLALAGKSASHIAAALGVASRNAVIGKASRMGVKLGGGARGPGTLKARAGRPQWASAPYTRPGAVDQGSDVALVSDPGVQLRERRAAWTLGEAEIGEMRRLRFEDIREFACRWPLGDPRSGEFAYCGLAPAKGQSYCAGHCRMAYRAPQARQSARERQELRALASSWRPS
jgi:GcrA cell cycle regulator